MVLKHLVKISGLIQILCNLSINLVYIIYLIAEEAIPNGYIPDALPYNVLILLCIIPGYFSLTTIDDKYLKMLLLLGNVVVTVLLFILYTNLFKTFVVDGL